MDSVVLSSGLERVQSDADARTEILRHLPATACLAVAALQKVVLFVLTKPLPYKSKRVQHNKLSNL